MKYRNVKELSINELFDHLITPDGRGKEYKISAFKEIMKREWWKVWKWFY